MNNEKNNININHFHLAIFRKDELVAAGHVQSPAICTRHDAVIQRWQQLLQVR